MILVLSLISADITDKFYITHFYLLNIITSTVITGDVIYEIETSAEAAALLKPLAKKKTQELVEKVRSRLEKYNGETLLLISELLTELAAYATDQDPKRIPKILRAISELKKKMKFSNQD